MKHLLCRWLLPVALAVAPYALATVDGTDNSDLWWNPNESGWGLQVVHTGHVIFVTMFVYDANRNPVWYTGTGNPDPTGFVWSGDLYQTTGPFFAAVPFDPASVTATRVGTFAFDVSPPQSVAEATLRYSVGGVAVLKHIQRQPLRFDDFSGSYLGMFRQTHTCSDPSRNGTFDVPVGVTITHGGGNAFTMSTNSADGVTCTFSGGVYGQEGRFGHVSGGTYGCSDGTAGAFRFFEMYVNISGFLARGQLNDQACSSQLHWGGVRG
jgi:hypothetical protein